LVG
jgi:hypothetical protein